MPEIPPWLMLVISLSGQNATARMRIWRALKAAGAGALRDGVYLLPTAIAARQVLDEQAREVERAGGSAHVVSLAAADATQEAAFRALFDRNGEFLDVQKKLDSLFADVDAAATPEGEARRRLSLLQREFDALSQIDFFSSPARRATEAHLADAEPRLNRRYAPDEPHTQAGTVPRRDPADFQDQLWATRAGLWVDRVASAWLIRRFIDPAARFRWLKSIEDCPKKAMGFDFDGATFTHVGQKVTFEVLMASFGLEADPGLAGIAALVHYLDVGGVSVPEAAGFCAVLAGARVRLKNDDALLAAMSDVLDDLHAAYADPSLIVVAPRP